MFYKDLKDLICLEPALSAPGFVSCKTVHIAQFVFPFDWNSLVWSNSTIKSRSGQIIVRKMDSSYSEH